MVKKYSAKQLILCGFMGTGKTEVGEKLSQRLNRSFIDTDRLIVRQVGDSIAGIFKTSGEKYFRDLETKAISELFTHRPGSLVVATGGGALIRPENLKVLQEMGPLILLTASHRAILRRIRAQEERPLLTGIEDLKERIEALLEERARVYEACDYRFETTGKTANRVAAEIIRTLDL